MAEISPLRRRMIDDVMILNPSPATQQFYLYALPSSAAFFGVLAGMAGIGGSVRAGRDAECGVRQTPPRCEA